jgi:hypothetical protein
VLPLAADENFNAHIVRGLESRLPQVDLVTVQAANLRAAQDPYILEWAAAERRVLLTHDVNTVTRYAWARIREGLSMPGVIAVPSAAPIGAVVEDLVLVLAIYEGGDLEGQILYLPL